MLNAKFQERFRLRQYCHVGDSTKPWEWMCTACWEKWAEDRPWKIRTNSQRWEERMMDRSQEKKGPEGVVLNTEILWWIDSEVV